MTTSFRLTRLSDKADLLLERFQQALPAGMLLREEDSHLYVDVPSSIPEDRRTQYLVERELDRIFFLTCVRYRAEMVTRTVTETLKVSWSALGQLSSTVQPMQWTYERALQLRLGAIAADVKDPATRVLLLFQIVELQHPDSSEYPPYDDPTQPPQPLTECKMLRHLVAHAGEARGRELQQYCVYLGLPPLMLDRTDAHYSHVISTKVRLVEEQARRILAAA